MNVGSYTGVLIKMLRLQRNWSQETLCKGICAVSYLSKIEQGKVQPNQRLLKDLFARLDVPWQTISEGKSSEICENLYETVFADERTEFARNQTSDLLDAEGFAMGVNCLDHLVLRAYCFRDRSLIPEVLRPLLDNRQRCLLYLLEEEPEEALRIYPCALTAEKAGIRAYTCGRYTEAIAILQHGYDMACQNGYVKIMMYCQLFIANCYSDVRNISNMLSHYAIAKRLARSLGETELVQTIEYNIASTGIECGEYEAGYHYFAKLDKRSVLDAHKLAICCEKLNKHEEALCVLDAIDDCAWGVEKQMCDLVRYRVQNTQYLKDPLYGEMLLGTFAQIRKELPVGYACFHLPWVEEWCSANRQYRTAYEILRDFTK